jgi:DNA mismatch endonuclease (patch repair protein)
MKPVDVHDKATRSKNMRAIGQRDTAIEKRLPRCSLRPDLRLPFRMRRCRGARICRAEYRCVIFTHGCFWHHHRCYLFKVPATRTAFWLDKIGKNVARDSRDIMRWQSRVAGADRLGMRAARATEAER